MKLVAGTQIMLSEIKEKWGRIIKLYIWMPK